MKILLAEDETRMASALVELFQVEKYDVDHVADGVSAVAALEGGVYDCAVIDIMMPEMNGIDVIKTVRSRGVRTPILVLTAKTELDDVVIGLDAGADDYMTKPFQVRELLARMRALCRRNTHSRDGWMTFGDISLDTSTAILHCEKSGQSVRLSEKEFRIMEYLIANQDRILSRELLVLKVWGTENDAEYNKVEVYLSFIRRKLAFIQSETEIKAVRGIGYELRYFGV